ncbi:MAG: DNA repair protein RadA, partial [Rhodospirillaceae bacterium]|nr:DNA repair protein RadA [Rhodospirillaceae bacterium]
TVVGWDSGRLAMIAAVLESRCGLALGGHDIYLNVAGGLRVTEPAADAAVAAALVSSFRDSPVSPGAVVFGEIGLSGEIRAVTQMDQRLREAAKLGFTEAWMPKNSGRRKQAMESKSVAIESLGHVQALVDKFS